MTEQPHHSLKQRILVMLHSTYRVNVILFALFSFFYFYVLQADVMALVSANVFGPSLGYSDFFGALGITVVLEFVAFLFHHYIWLQGRLQALVFLPSFLLMAILTQSIEGFPWSLFAVFLVVVLIVCPMLRKLRRHFHSNKHFLLQLIYNLILFILLCTLGALAGNTNDVFHYELKIQRNLLRGNDEAAIHVGEESLATGHTLTALRAYVLARQGKIGDLLFSFPMRYRSSALLPDAADSTRTLYPLDSIYLYIGDMPLPHEKTSTFFARLSTCPTLLQHCPALRDYRLCALLLDKKLDMFVVELKRLYPLNAMSMDSLPTHYKEALLLYKFLRTHPLIIYDNAVMMANFNDFLDLQKSYPSPIVRANFARRSYGNTYWWYFFFG